MSAPRPTAGSVSFPLLGYINSDDIVKATKSEGVAGALVPYQKAYAQINVQKAMKDLALVGDLLKAAYAGSRDFPCSVKIREIVSGYQDTIHNAFLVCDEFVNSCLQALRNHQKALNALDQKKGASAALVFIKRCEETAGKMVSLSDRMVTESDTLCKKAESACTEACNQDQLTGQQKKDMEAALVKQKAREEELKSLRDNLSLQVTEEQAKEIEAGKKAQEALGRAFPIAIISAIIKPIAAPITGIVKGLTKKIFGETGEAIDKVVKDLADQKVERVNQLQEARVALAGKEAELSKASEERKNLIKIEIAQLEQKITNFTEEQRDIEQRLDKLVDGLRDEAKAYQAQEERATAARRALQAKMRETVSELSSSVVVLENLSNQVNSPDSHINLSIKSLEITMKTLSVIKTVFVNTRTFWQQIKTKCEALTKSEDIQDALDNGESELRNAIEQSGYSWITTGDYCLQAVHSIAQVREHIDRAATLPTRDEAQRILRGGSPFMESLKRQIKENGLQYQEEDSNNNNR